jgi:uncharacterized protein DUF4386
VPGASLGEAARVDPGSGRADPAHRGDGMTLRRAALIAGIAYLLMPVTFAEFYVFPKLLIAGNIEQTVQNIVAHERLFVVGMLCHLVTLMLDVVIAWALYILLAPVNRSLSLLAAWFRLVYVAAALVGLMNLVNVFRLLHTPDYLAAFGSQQLHAQAKLLLASFRADFSMSLFIFGIHLGLVGYLVYRSGYIPRVLGIVLALMGALWVTNSLRPYLFPNALPGFLWLFGFGELLFPLWLVIRGWKIPEPARG